jgi:hypothetical protein
MVEHIDNSKLRMRVVTLFCTSRKYKEEAESAASVLKATSQALKALGAKHGDSTVENARLRVELEECRDTKEWYLTFLVLTWLIAVLIIAAVLQSKGVV